MLGRLAAVFLVFSWLPDCKGAGEPGSFEKFLRNLSGSPPNRAEMCSEANDGKRYWIEGYLQLPNSIQIRKNRTTLEFFARLDRNGQGEGRRISIEVTTPGDIEDLMAAATGKKYRGRSTTGQIDVDALRIRTTNGVATARDKIKLTVDVVGLPEREFLFSRQLATCEYRFVKAEKL